MSSNIHAEMYIYSFLEMTNNKSLEKIGFFVLYYNKRRLPRNNRRSRNIVWIEDGTIQSQTADARFP